MINGIADEKIIVISHFHQDHAANGGRIKFDELYASKETIKHTHTGSVISDKIVFDDDITALTVPSSHAKGCVIVVCGDFAFLGDCAYAGFKHGKRLYNVYQLGQLIKLLEGLDVKYFGMSHYKNFIYDRETVLTMLRVMPGGSHPELGEKAAELWHSGLAPIVFVSGGVSVKTGKFPGAKSKTDIYDGNYSTDCEFLTDVLVKNGVALSAIFGEDKSGYTKQNALYAKAALDKLKIYPKSAIIVCKAFHARRCQMCYQLAFPDTRLYVVTVAGFGITRDNWYESEYGITRVMGELSRCGQQFTREWIEEL